jgi:hypothetical protein
VISVAIYTTEGIPIYKSDPQKLAPFLVPFIDRYGVWMTYAPALEGGTFRCYVGARFDHIKESPVGRLNREVLLVSFERPEEANKTWHLFEASRVEGLFRQAGLYPEEPKGEVDIGDEEIKKLYSEVISYINSLRPAESGFPYRESRVRGFTDVKYPTLFRRYIFLGVVLAAVKEFLKESCVPPAVEKSLELISKEVGDISYPVVVYSNRGNRTLGGLWFPTGGM